MFELLKNNPRYLVGAIIVHLVFLILFGVGFHFKSEHRAAVPEPQIIKVSTVDERMLKQEIQKQKRADEQEKRRKQEAIEKRKAEEAKLKKIREERLAEQQKEQKRLALLKQKQLEEQKRLKKLEEERRRKEAEEKRLREEEEKRRQQEQQAREDELREKLKQEEERLKKEQELAALRQAEIAKKQTLIDKYMNLIEAKVKQKWIRPPGDLTGKVAVLEVKLIPSGDVIDIELSKSSGDSAYDKSVQQAVRQASPLPLPPADTGLSDEFRNLTLPMRADKKT